MSQEYKPSIISQIVGGAAIATATAVGHHLNEQNKSKAPAPSAYTQGADAPAPKDRASSEIDDLGPPVHPPVAPHDPNEDEDPLGPSFRGLYNSNPDQNH